MDFAEAVYLTTYGRQSKENASQNADNCFRVDAPETCAYHEVEGSVREFYVANVEWFKVSSDIGKNVLL